MLKSFQTFDVNKFISESNQIKKIPIDKLVSYHNHQFKLYTGERLEDMIESIKKNGILNPILVQPINDGYYEILSGHNRVEGAKQVGLTTIPAIIKEGLSEEEAEMYVIETNLMQRGFTDLSISEQAHVLKVQHSKMFSQGKRNDIIAELERLENNSTLSKDKKITSLDKVGNEYGMSRPTVARLIRVNYLIEPFKEMINLKKMPIMVGVELSYLSNDAQSIVYEVAKNHHKKIDIKLSKTIRQLFNDNPNFTIDMLENIIITGNNSAKNKLIKVPLNQDIYTKYFDKKTPPNEVADTIKKALEMYFSSLK